MVNRNQNRKHKIDTEGHEYQVLLGSETSLEISNLTSFLKLIRYVHKCLNYLTDFDYSFFVIDDRNNKLFKLDKNNNSIKLGKEELIVLQHILLIRKL